MPVKRAMDQVRAEVMKARRSKNGNLPQTGRVVVKNGRDRAIVALSVESTVL